MTELDCIKHCDSACCKFSKYLRFSKKEALMLEASGTALKVMGEEGVDGRSEYIKNGNCGLEVNGACGGYELRPKTCRDFRMGSRDCLRFRAEHPEAVKELTPTDIEFQGEYFGWNE